MQMVNKMYNTIRLPEEIYDEAKLLGSKLEKNKVLAGVHHISLSTAVGFAITKTLELLDSKIAENKPKTIL